MWGLKKDKKTDGVFLFYIIFFLLLGLMILYSSASAFAYQKFNGDTYYFIKGQLLRGILPGLVLLLIFAKLDYQAWYKWGRYLFFFTVALLILVFIPGIGTDYGKVSSSWINLYFFSFQPSELAKLALVVVMAKLLSEPERDLTDFKTGILPLLFTVSPLFFLVVFQPDLGTLSILCIIAFSMLVMAGVDKKTLGLIAVVGILSFTLLIALMPKRAERFTVFLHPELNSQGIGYHINQAYLAVGSGGLWGLGYGHSRQKHQYLPEVQADSIFAVFAEEMGFFISVGFVIMFLLFALRGLKISREAPDQFGRLLVGGIVVWFFMQACLNMAAMVGGSPLTGVPLPFVSHGGSAMLVGLASLGIILNVSKKN